MNGTTEGAQSVKGNGTKPWERVWSVDEMRKSASNWHLANDVGMLLHLQDFCQRMLTQTHDIQEQIDVAVHEAKLTSVRVNNVFNEFITLANTQFVENRVYDEDVSQLEDKEDNKKAEDKECSKEERDSQLITRIKQAVCLGLNVLDSDYDRLENYVDNSDSDDEDSSAKQTVMFEPKDPYIHRQFPHLIGSDEFDCADDVGLNITLPEEEESLIESVVTVVTDEISVQPDTQQTVQRQQSRQPPIDTDSSSEDSDDLFGETQKTNKSQINTNRQQQQQQENNSQSNDVHAELTSRSKDGATQRQDSQQEQQATKTKRKSDDMFTLPFGDGDDDDGDGDIFGKPTGLFAAPSKKSALFSDAEEGNLFGTESNIVKDSTTAVKAVLPTSKLTATSVTSKGLFDDDDDDLFTAKTTKTAPPTAAKTAPPAATKTVKNVDDLFAADDDNEDEDIFKQTKQQVPKHRVLAGAVPVFSLAGDEQFKAAIARSGQSRSTSEQAEDDDDDKLKPSAIKSLSNVVRGGSASPSTQSSNSLFTDEPEPFVSAVKTTTVQSLTTTTTKPATTQATVSRPKVNLFDEDEDDEGDLFASFAKPSKNTGPATTVGSGKEKASKLMMEDEEDLFASISKVNKTASQVPSGKLPTQQVPTVDHKVVPSEAVKPPSTRPVMSLFDDDDLDQEPSDFFGTKQTITTTAAPTQSKVGSLSLFGDDVLFGSSASEEPSVDLFGSNPSSPLSTPAKSSVNKLAAVDVRSVEENVVVKSDAKPTPRVVDLFADIDNDDLFAPIKTQTTKQTATNKDSVVQHNVASDDLFSTPLAPSSVQSSKPSATTTTVESTSKKSAPMVAAKHKDKALAHSDNLKTETLPTPSEGRVGKIAQLQSSLAINPASLLPTREAKTRLEPDITANESKTAYKNQLESDVISFDEPLQTQTLHSVAKDRVRIQAKRRPPTRHVSRPDDLFSDVTDDSVTPKTVSEHSSKAGVAIEHLSFPAADGKEPLFSQSAVGREFITNEVIPADSGIVTKEAMPAVKQSVNIANDTDAGAKKLSSGVTDKTLPVAKETTNVTKEDGAVVSRKIAPVVSDDLFDFPINKPDASTTKKKIGILDDDDDDIFADSSLKTRGAVKSSKTEAITSSEVADIFADKNLPLPKSSRDQVAIKTTTAKPLIDDDEDIFADSLLSKPVKKPISTKDVTASDDIFGTKSATRVSKVKPVANIFDDDDDDIFAVKTTPSLSKQTTKSALATSVASSKTNDDLFGPSPRQPAQARKKYATRDEDLFADDTDIFAEISSTRPKPTMATKTQLAETDDIFADVTSKPTRAAKSSTVAVKKITDTDDIFDDPLNAFNT